MNKKGRKNVKTSLDVSSYKTSDQALGESRRNLFLNDESVKEVILNGSIDQSEDGS